MAVDEARLDLLRAEYHQMQQLQGFTPQSRGQRLNKLFAEVLQCWGIVAMHTIRGAGEIDVAFSLDGHRYIVEAKWESTPTNTGHLAKLQKRLRQRLAGTYGIFLSVNGYSREALADLTHGERLEVLLLDATHLEAMLTGRITPDQLLSYLHNRAAWYGEAYVPISQVVAAAPAPTSGPPTVSVADTSSPDMQPGPRHYGWTVLRADRGNPPGQYHIFHARSGLYWAAAIVYSVLILLLAVFLVVPEIPIWIKIGSGLFQLLLIIGVVVSVRMAAAPIRLEIGAEGIQVFSRTQTTWFPWHVIQRVEVMRLEGGATSLVAWCPAPNAFPEFPGVGRANPRFVRRLGAVAICPLSILRTRRHLVIQALHTFSGNRTGAL